MELFDSHCHLDDEQFSADRPEAIDRMRAAGVTRCLCPGSDLASSRAALALAEAYPFIYAAAGVHPHEAEKAPADYLEQLEALLANPRVRALGEIGLDFHYDFSPRDVQERVMDAQVALALRLDRPVIFHIREAHGEMTDYFRSLPRKPRGVIHCFSGSAETARDYLRMGFYISFAGPLTFKKAPHLWEAAAAVPMNRLLVETDSPYMAPDPLRGRRNEPANVRLVLEKLAQLKGVTAEEMAAATVQNAMDVYEIRKE